MTISKKKIKEFRNVQSRQYLFEEHIESGLPIQIRELRKKRGLTQKQLAALTGYDQSNISNWENPNYEYTPQISTLKGLANAFDVPLIVRFGSWSELLEWDNSISGDRVAPDTFDDEFEDIHEDQNGDASTFVDSSGSNVVKFPTTYAGADKPPSNGFSLPFIAAVETGSGSPGSLQISEKDDQSDFSFRFSGSSDSWLATGS